MDTPQLLALAGALGWASGFRLYAVLFLTGAAGYMGWVPLPSGLHLLQHPAMLAASGFMFAVEFFADKIPFVDTIWDMVHTAIRIPAGAALATAALGADNATITSVAALLGGTLAATAHATKMTTRAAANLSPEPFSNVAISLFEDGLVIGIFWLANNYPLAFGITLGIAVLLMVTILIVLMRFFKQVFRRVSGFFTGAPVLNTGAGAS